MKKRIFSVTKLVCAIAGILNLGHVAVANEANSILDSVAEGKVKVNMRARFESVDQDGIINDANAGTLRTRLTYKTADFKGFNILAEVDNVSAMGQYNSTANGKSDYPVVADPKGTDINQIALNFKKGGLSLTAGRQRIVQDGQRFIGGVAWRQNEQTYDGYSASYNFNKAIKVDYSYIYNVNRIFGPTDPKSDLKGDFHLVHGKFNINKMHKITTFIYDLDFDTAASLSSQTIGIDYIGKIGKLKLHGSYAVQTDTGSNTLDYSADYFAFDAGYNFGVVKLIAGLEVLGSDENVVGSDDGVAFKTPLATLHKFQGFADKFLATPDKGIQDVYVKVVGKIGSVGVSATYHDFETDAGSTDLGSELDLTAKYKFNKRVTGLLKYADYNADSHATDTNKLWAMVNVNF